MNTRKVNIKIVKTKLQDSFLVENDYNKNEPILIDRYKILSNEGYFSRITFYGEVKSFTNSLSGFSTS